MTTCLLKKREVASMLKVSTRTLERRIAAGDIPAVRCGGQIRLHRQAVIKYVKTLPASRTFVEHSNGR